MSKKRGIELVDSESRSGSRSGSRDSSHAELKASDDGTASIADTADAVDTTDAVDAMTGTVAGESGTKRSRRKIAFEKEKIKPPKYKINDPPTDRPVRIYVDGIYDLFHFGHMRQLEQAKKKFENVYLMVGVVNDRVTHQYKGLTVMRDVERYESLRHCRWVDEVIENAPWCISKEFLDEHEIDFVAHDDLPYASADVSDVYAHIKAMGKFLPTMRTKSISTTELVTRIISNYDNYLLRNLARGIDRREMNVGFIKSLELELRRNLGRQYRTARQMLMNQYERVKVAANKNMFGQRRRSEAPLEAPSDISAQASERSSSDSSPSASP